MLYFSEIKRSLNISHLLRNDSLVSLHKVPENLNHQIQSGRITTVFTQHPVACCVIERPQKQLLLIFPSEVLAF